MACLAAHVTGPQKRTEALCTASSPQAVLLNVSHPLSTKLAAESIDQSMSLGFYGSPPFAWEAEQHLIFDNQ